MEFHQRWHQLPFWRCLSVFFSPGLFSGSASRIRAFPLGVFVIYLLLSIYYGRQWVSEVASFNVAGLSVYLWHAATVLVFANMLFRWQPFSLKPWLFFSLYFEGLGFIQLIKIISINFLSEAFWMGDSFFWLFFFLQIIFVAWLVAISCRQHLLQARQWMLVYLLVVILPVMLVLQVHGWLWYPEQEGAEQEKIDVESLFYQQENLLQQQLGGIKSSSDGIDLYFVGVAAYAEQDVFMSEVKSAQTLFDKQYGSTDRSIILINNRDTASNVAMANQHNIQRVLNHLGKIMGEEDILFFMLTSHGSDDWKISTRYNQVPLNDLTPQGLQQALDESGIKWQLVMISSCFSGGFIPDLKNDNRLVATAASAERASFGCSHLRDFTYFGEATIDGSFVDNMDFELAFKQAAESIRLRESDEGLTPSEPQLWVGDKIKQQLSLWYDQLKQE